MRSGNGDQHDAYDTMRMEHGAWGLHSRGPTAASRMYAS